MIKQRLSFSILLILCISCSVINKEPFDPSKKYSPAQLSLDFSLLHKILNHHHPGLYWYATADSVEPHFTAVEKSLVDSLTEQAFRNKISWALNAIHCGHTTVRSSKNYTNYSTKQRTPLFPLSLKIWDDSAAVVNVLSPAIKDSGIPIKRGTVITGINNYPIKKIIDSMSQLIGADGYSNIFKFQLISFNFPAYYKNTYGTDSTYLVNYLDDKGQPNEITLKNFDVKADTIVRKLPPEGLRKRAFKKLQLLNNRNFRIDSSTAFMSVNTFSKGKLNRFFRKSFKTINDQNISNVVIDLRLNSGGSVLTSIKFLQYLIAKPFHVADTVAAFTRSFPYKKHVKPWFIYWLSMHTTGTKLDDNRIHFKYFENHLFKPKKKNHFDGHIYLITGGYTFSAASLVSSKLKGQQNVSVVGEETGGGAYGNSAMFLSTITLPNTKIRVTLPLYRMVFNADLPKSGRGVFPDVEVKPTSIQIKAGLDAKQDKLKELIKQRSY